MVKNANMDRFDKSCGRIRIGFSDLVELLEEFSIEIGEKVTAKNGEYEFESIEDIKLHEALFVGFPKIEIGKLSMRFSDFEFSMYAYSLNAIDNSLQQKYMNLFQTLKKHKDWPNIVTGSLWMTATSILLVLFAYMYIPVHGISPFDRFSEGTFNVIDIIVFSFWIWFQFALWPLNKIHSVYHTGKKDGFIKRNFDKIAVGLIMLILGAIIGQYL